MRLRLPNSLTPAGFLERYWQKRALVMPGALPHLQPELTPEELAWLATLDDVESRLVFTEKHRGKTRYRLQHGPFPVEQLAGLPESGWTLLVQDVDKHLPVFRDLLCAVQFIPDWRLDDVMVSYAAPGGSVGPHQDNYDVFLVQGSGARKWTLSDEAAVRRDTASAKLSLLEPFSGDEQVTCRRGDVLYLPPGVPHWGVAEESCMTYSIGARALEAVELQLAVQRLYPEVEEVPQPHDRRFYADPDLGPEESVPGGISMQAIDRAIEAFPMAASLSREKFAIAFGCAVTDPKAWLAPEGLAPEACDEVLSDNDAVWIVHGMAKLAWCDLGASAFAFVNGVHRRVDSAELAFLRDVCRRRTLDDTLRLELANRSRHTSAPGLLQFLLGHGAIDHASLSSHK